MKVTNAVLALIYKRLRDPKKRKINQSQLAEHMGLGKAWVSKLMHGGIKNLSPEQVDKLEEFLEITLHKFADKRHPIPSIALEIAAKIEESEPIARIVAALLEIDAPANIKWIETQDMTRIGQEIIRISFANEDKPGKVASETIKLLSVYLAPGP